MFQFSQFKNTSYEWHLRHKYELPFLLFKNLNLDCKVAYIVKNKSNREKLIESVLFPTLYIIN